MHPRLNFDSVSVVDFGAHQGAAVFEFVVGQVISVVGAVAVAAVARPLGYPALAAVRLLEEWGRAGLDAVRLCVGGLGFHFHLLG